jgi:type VI secretion system protein ImpF
VPIKLSIIDRLVAGPSPASDVSSISAAVIRDLLSLLNTWEILPPFGGKQSADVESSVLNYGVPNVAGKTVSPSSLSQYETDITTAIRRFEQRINPETLVVTTSEPNLGGSNAVFSLNIEGDFVGLETPRRLVFRSQVSSATGRVELV